MFLSAGQVPSGFWSLASQSRALSTAAWAFGDNGWASWVSSGATVAQARLLAGLRRPSMAAEVASTAAQEACDGDGGAGTDSWHIRLCLLVRAKLQLRKLRPNDHLHCFRGSSFMACARAFHLKGHSRTQVRANGSMVMSECRPRTESAFASSIRGGCTVAVAPPRGTCPGVDRIGG